MRIVSHVESETDPAFLDAEAKWLDNRDEPVVRIGGEPFECHFAPECHTETFVVDPRRSLAAPLCAAMSRPSARHWQASDFLMRLVQDVGCRVDRPSIADQVAFRTIFPSCAAAILDSSWAHVPCFNKAHGGIPRVINNPFFHRLPDASDSRLLEIASHMGLAYAIDLSATCPDPTVLAREIALLSHVQDGEAVVAADRADILPQVATVLT